MIVSPKNVVAWLWSVSLFSSVKSTVIAFSMDVSVVVVDIVSGVVAVPPPPNVSPGFSKGVGFFSLSVPFSVSHAQKVNSAIISIKIMGSIFFIISLLFRLNNFTIMPFS